MLVARCIVYLNLYLLAVDVLGAAEDVEDSRLVLISERVLQEVRDEAGLTYRGVANEHELELLWSVRVLFYDCLTRLRLRLLYLWLCHAIVWLLNRRRRFRFLFRLSRLIIFDLILFNSVVNCFVNQIFQRFFLA